MADLSKLPLYSVFSWNASRKSFEQRKRGKREDEQPDIFKETTIGRLYLVHPDQDECVRFNKRLLVARPFQMKNNLNLV